MNVWWVKTGRRFSYATDLAGEVLQELIGQEVGVDSRWLRQQTFELLPECLGVVAGAADGVRPVLRELPLQQRSLTLEL